MHFHQPGVTFLLDLFGHVVFELVGIRTFDLRVCECADAIQSRGLEEVQQDLKILFGLAGKANDEGRSEHDFRADFAPTQDRLELFSSPWSPHGFQDARAGVLQWHIQVRQDFALRHQLHDLFDMRVWVDVMQAHPRAQLAKFRAQINQMRDDLLALKLALTVPNVHAVSARVLRDHQQFLAATRHEPVRLVQDFARVAGDLQAAQFGDDAKRTGVVAALGDFQVTVMARRELDSGRQQGRERILVRRNQLMNRLHHPSHIAGTGHARDVRVSRHDRLWTFAEATGDNHLAGLLERLTDCTQTLFNCGRDKAAGVDHHHFRVFVRRSDLIPLGTKLRQDAFAVHQRLWATEADESHFSGFGLRFGDRI